MPAVFGDNVSADVICVPILPHIMVCVSTMSAFSRTIRRQQKIALFMDKFGLIQDSRRLGDSVYVNLKMRSRRLSYYEGDGYSVVTFGNIDKE